MKSAIEFGTNSDFLASAADAQLGRITDVIDSELEATIESYQYLGAGTIVSRTRPEAGLSQTYYSASAGDYTGLDKFGRVVEQQWTLGGATVDHWRYGYDANSNLLYKHNIVNPAMSELYQKNPIGDGTPQDPAYDKLDRLTFWQRGTLANSAGATRPNTINNKLRENSWLLDAQGGWLKFFDGARMNVTAFDSRNRPVETAREGISAGQADKAGYVIDSSGAVARIDADASRSTTQDLFGRGTWTQTTYSGRPPLDIFHRYDGLGRRVLESYESVHLRFVYDLSGQVIAEYKRFGESGGEHWELANEYAWAPDGRMIFVEDQNRDTQGVAGTARRYYPITDSAGSTTALIVKNISDQWVVKDRYVYDPKGLPMRLQANWDGAVTPSKFDHLFGQACGWCGQGSSQSAGVAR